MTKTLQIPMVIPALLVAGALSIPAFAQQSNSQAQIQTGATATATAPNTNTNLNPNNNATYATGQPLTVQHHEGFWGHLNPFARKKWVNRQLDPVKGRLNELDQLQAKNARDISDVDARAQAGIHQAETTAGQASETATNANNTATQASQLAQQANTRDTQLTNAVSTIDQYHAVNGTLFRFRPGQTLLHARAKDALGQMVQQLQTQKGYIVEVTGYSHLRGQAGLRNSRQMAMAVSRYLAEHQIPVYRIHQVAMGHSPMKNGEYIRRGSAVQVTVMQNSLAALNAPSADGGSPIGAMQQPSAQPSPQGAASQPTDSQN